MIGFNNKKIGFIIDTSFGLDSKVVDIRVVPLGVAVTEGTNTQAYKDGVDFDPNHLMKVFANKDCNIKTSQASMPDMMAAATEMSKEYDEVYVFPIHKVLSGNFNTWNIIKEDFPKLKVVMSYTIANTLFWLINDFRKELERREFTESQAQAWFDEECKYIAGFLLVQDMGQLVKGGRVSRLKAGIASLLGIKPVILQDETGLKPINKVKDFEGFLKAADEYVTTKWPGKRTINELILVQRYFPDETKALDEAFEKHYGHKSAEIHEQPLCVSSHAGAKSCSVMFRVVK